MTTPPESPAALSRKSRARARPRVVDGGRSRAMGASDVTTPRTSAKSLTPHRLQERRKGVDDVLAPRMVDEAYTDETLWQRIASSRGLTAISGGIT